MKAIRTTTLVTGLFVSLSFVAQGYAYQPGQQSLASAGEGITAEMHGLVWRGANHLPNTYSDHYDITARGCAGNFEKVVRRLPPV